MTDIAAAITSPWRKSSYSGGNNECVEVTGLNLGGIAVRDSKNPHGPVLTFAPDAWHAFVAEVRSGNLTG